ncbi:Zinc finger C2H2 [Penicillium frequentans]|nr:Zinc finger C2H2 [Penicillium glabrum]
MPANIYNSSKLASNNLHPFNAFPASRPISPLSEGASPDSFFSAWAKRSARHSLKMERTPHNRPVAVLPELNTQDPYLSVSSDQEELEFQAFALRLTPVGGSPNHASPSPIGENDALSAGPTIQTNYWPAGNDNPSSCASPDSGGFLDPSNIELNGPNWQDQRSYHVGTTAPVAQEQWPSAVAEVPPQQWLNADPTIPSPLSIQDQATAHKHAPNQVSLANADQRYGPAELTVTTEYVPGNGLVSASTIRGRSPLRSPIGITVESVSRGDSPVAGNLGHSRRPSRSSMHLSPGGMSSDSEDDGHVDDDHRSVSSLSVARTNDGKWIRSPTTGHGGLAPSSRGVEYVQSPNDLKGQRERDQKNQHITLWLSAASTGSDGDQPPTPPPQRRHTRNRLRARSTGDKPLQQEDYFSLKSHGSNMTPGPGVLVHESEGSDDDGDDVSSVKSDASASGSPPADVNEPGRYDSFTPECYASLGSTGPTESFCLHPWQDCSRDSTQRKEAMQPGSSTAAMIAFEKRAKDIETASLTATVDNNSLFHVRSAFTEMSITAEPKPKESVGTLFQRSFLTATSKLKRQASDFSIANANTNAQPNSSDVPQRKESHSHRHRLSLSGRQHGRAPSVTNAFFSMSGQMAAIGGNNAVHAVSPSTDVTLKGNSMKGRGRSRSEVPRPVNGLMALMTTHGGPPVANFFSSPRTSTEGEHVRANDVADVNNMSAKDEDDDEDHMDVADDKGLVMKFPLVSRLPVPTLEGFKQQIMDLNPRLKPALIERFAREQVNRYDRLVRLQRDHAAAVTNRKCKSDNFCFALGGKAEFLEQRKASTVEAGQTQFLITESINGGSYVVTEGSPTPAQFPAGVPIPPVSRLPAKFECSICYDVKKVHKPSDWSKHVQEDLQPFTCSFPDCTEPKSFKRKADWVRHENEKHRQLEWWDCSRCDHTCYRKDNFVQHLVREHKMPDPKVKKGTGGAEEQSSRDRLAKLLDECRHETTKTSQSEPCQFCGNILGNWKKLTVHLGKHMEQLAMPVLELAKQSTTTPSPAAPAGVSSGSAETYPPLSVPFHGHQNTAGATLPTPQYLTSKTSPPVNASIPYDMSLLDYPSTISGTILSTEPEPIADTFPGDQYSYISPLGQATLHPPSAQTHLPHHQNSVTYPPPYNAIHQPRTPDVNASVMPSYQLPQSSLYPAQASYPPYQYMAPTSSYPGSYTNSYSSQM